MPFKSKYLALKFFCDWALHIKLEREAACRILEQFDNALDAGDDDKTIRGAVEKLGPTISFSMLRDEFISLLMEYDLPTGVAGKMLQWGRFLELYLSVVKDCPLSYSRKLPLKHIDELKLAKYDDPPQGNLERAIFAFGIR